MEKNHTPLNVRDLRTIADNLTNVLTARGYMRASVMFRIGDGDSFYELALTMEYKVDADSATTYETIRPRNLSEFDPNMDDVREFDLDDVHWLTRCMIDAAYVWIARQPTVLEAKQAELVRTMERAKVLAGYLGVEDSVGNILVDLMKQLATNALTHQR